MPSKKNRQQGGGKHMVNQPSNSTQPFVPPPPPVTNDADGLARKKAELEVAKLQRELGHGHNLRERLAHAFWSVKLNEWVLALTAFAAIFMTFRTGLFDAVRQHLAAQQERLTIEKINLEQKKEQLTADVAAKEQELASLRARLLPFEQEDEAFRQLKNYEATGIEAQFGSYGKLGSLKVAFQPWKQRIDWLSFSDPSRVATLSETIRAANRLRNVKGLRLSELILTPEDVSLATSRQDLEILAIIACDMDDRSYQSLRPVASLKTLDLLGNKLSTLPSSAIFPDVQTIRLRFNPISDEGLASIASNFPNIVDLDLEGTNVSDDGLKHLAGLGKLNGLRLLRTRVTGQGALRLLDCSSLKRLRLDKEQTTPQILAIFKEKKPELTVQNAESQDELVRRAFADELWRD